MTLLARNHPEIDARLDDAQSIPVKDAFVNAVVCAQSFHDFASAATLTKIHRVLKPGGRLGLVWNVQDESVPLGRGAERDHRRLRRRHTALPHAGLACGLPHFGLQPS